MIVFILFVVACLAFQELVNALRGTKKPKVRIAKWENFNMRSVAECGCDLLNGKVVNPCKAHEILRRVVND